jgi:hypothetical protein
MHLKNKTKGITTNSKKGAHIEKELNLNYNV